MPLGGLCYIGQTILNFLLCESDDLVLEYSLHSVSEHECVFLHTKQKEINMQEEERVKLANLKKGTQLRTEHTETQALALRQLHVLHGLVQFYLGS
ncbi:hypothetical protein ACOMHN_027099 [Nucella lapillus]